MTSEQARAFVGPRADYYLTRWDRLTERSSRALGFNFPAFFLSVFWLLYRRMYLWFWVAVATLVASLVIEDIALAAAGVQELPLLDRLIGIGVSAVFGTFGTYWYYLHAQRKIQRLSQDTVPELAAVARAGGTSWLTPVIALTVIVALMVLGWWADTQFPSRP